MYQQNEPSHLISVLEGENGYVSEDNHMEVSGQGYKVGGPHRLVAEIIEFEKGSAAMSFPNIDFSSRQHL